MAGPVVSNFSAPEWSNTSKESGTEPTTRVNDQTRKVSMQETINKVSRHKSLWDRPPSPVGFWRSDFPNTQELQAEKAEAKERQRQAVQERLNEALRCGKYIFRDKNLRPMAPVESP